MLPVRKSGGPGKEVPPERARTNRRKKERSATGNSLKKTRRPASTKWKRICPASVEGHANAVVHSERMKRRRFYHSRPIDRQKAQLTRLCVGGRDDAGEGAARRGERKTR